VEDRVDGLAEVLEVVRVGFEGDGDGCGGSGVGGGGKAGWG
jgi:hypothetical protein